METNNNYNFTTGYYQNICIREGYYKYIVWYNNNNTITSEHDSTRKRL